jgi:hypothetical protein
MLSSIAPDRLRGRYSDPYKPLLQAEVKAGSTDLATQELELKSWSGYGTDYGEGA